MHAYGFRVVSRVFDAMQCNACRPGNVLLYCFAFGKRIMLHSQGGIASSCVAALINNFVALVQAACSVRFLRNQWNRRAIRLA